MAFTIVDNDSTSYCSWATCVMLSTTLTAFSADACVSLDQPFGADTDTDPPFEEQDAEAQ